MNKLFIILLICILGLTFYLNNPVYAKNEGLLPDAGITPDSPFYFADTWSEQLTLIFTFKTENKVTKSLQYAKERLAEVDDMVAKNKLSAANKANNEYQKCMATAIEYSEQSRKKGVDTSETVVLAASEYLDLVNNTMCLATENALELLTETREITRSCQEMTLRTLAQEKPEKAIQLNLMLMEQQRSKLCANSEDTQATRLQEALQEYERLVNLNEELTQFAGMQSTGATGNHIVSQATDFQLQTFTQAQHRFQEQYQQVVTNSTQNCTQNQIRITNRFQSQNQTCQMQQNTTEPTGIPGNSRQRTANGESKQK